MRTTKILTLLARIVMGGLFLFSGANKLLHFMPFPPMPSAASAFLGALAATGYMLLLLGTVETVFGLLLIVGRFIPLSLVVLAPIVVNVALFHLLLAPQPAIAVIMLTCETYLAWVYRDAFRGVLQAAAPLATADAGASPVQRASSLAS